MTYPAYMTPADIAEFEIEYNRFLLDDAALNEAQSWANAPVSPVTEEF